MLRKLIRWLRPRISPSPQGFPMARAYYCTICQEVSDGRQKKCMANHTHKIVPLASFHALLTSRIHTLWNALQAAKKELKRGSVKTHNPTLYLTSRERPCP